MRRLTLLPAAAIILAATSCNRQPAKVETIEAEQPELASVISAGDPAHAVQFVNGVYEIEQGSWRWSRGKFSITLQVPGGATEKGARLCRPQDEVRQILGGSVENTSEELARAAAEVQSLVRQAAGRTKRGM